MGGTGEPTAETIEKGTSYTISTTVPAKTGYAFKGWATSTISSVDGELTVAYLPGETIDVVSSDMTLLAVWRASTYTVSFDRNYSTSSGGGSVVMSLRENSVSPSAVINNPNDSIVDTKIVTYGSPYGELPVVTRTGYTFEGWYTRATGGTKIESTTRVTAPRDHTLYAHWTAGTTTPTTVTVSFNYNGGSTVGVPYSRKDVTYGGTYGELPTATRTGYTFAGWYTAVNGGTRVTASTKVMNASNHTLYAHWTGNPITISYDANGGTGEPAAESGRIGTAYTISTTVPTRTDYTFKGWSTSSSATIASYTAGGTIPAESVVSDITLYAVWAQNNQAPNKPTVTQKTKTTSSITLNITGTDPDNDNLTYDIYMNGKKIGTTSKVASGATTTFATESNLLNYTLYRFYAIAKDTKGETTQGNEVTIRTYCPGTGASGCSISSDDKTCSECRGKGTVKCESQRWTWKNEYANNYRSLPRMLGI